MITLELHNEKIYLKLPDYYYTGFVSGKRTHFLKETLTIVDPASNLHAIVSFGEKTLVHEVDGFITNLSSNFDLESFLSQNKNCELKMRKCLSKEINKDIKKNCKKLTIKEFRRTKKKKKLENLEVFGVFSGTWVTKFYIDNELFWDISVERYKAHYVKDPLPSDYRFRNDFLWFLSGDLDMAQKWKNHYEHVYRMERKKREKLNSLRKTK